MQVEAEKREWALAAETEEQGQKGGKGKDKPKPKPKAKAKKAQGKKGKGGQDAEEEKERSPSGACLRCKMSLELTPLCGGQECCSFRHSPSAGPVRNRTRTTLSGQLSGPVRLPDFAA